MGRKTEYVTVPGWGLRDAGKVFKITEMDAARAEKWAYRMIFAVKGTTAQIPESLAGLGMVAIAVRGINSVLASDTDWLKLEPLLDEMFSCISIVRDPKARDASTGQPVESPIVSIDDIEDVITRGWLRSEVLRVHTNFSFIDGVLKWLSTMSTPVS